MELKRIVRHTLPSKFDSAPFGTICQANVGDDDYQLFIQLSETEESRWEPMGYLLEKAFQELIQNEEFIKELLVLITGGEYKNFTHMTEILGKQ